ncbi:RNA polymerase sigma factor [Solitalea canadensis]|uniref:RNA polymerase sigma factor, sigma-70 family n=1 Tax=Solitalea canadensis (strain ATCC 29591 / DSM 3403 / JCM 21819 / LMG 8368 / NBRC 15130 / NCIMB 12057 / USAM 9D) TaxID=929556 RepID=H8KWV0_SOLCM|nr:sigma-70 family RNA polymerase sigma factor [Solitalea canadensis]AFD08279.1 RNA polymerase sigma factor, sigma-70 family [Solitalea canadensis DSM 3403]
MAVADNIKKVGINETDLWAAFKEGDVNAYEQIYTIYYRQLYNYAHKYSSDKELINDLIHDLFIKIWSNKLSLGNPPSVKNYLFKSFRSHLFNHLRDTKDHASGTAEELESLNVFTLEVKPSPEADLIAREKAHHVNRLISNAIGQLTDRQREAIYLKYYEGFSYPEIAEIMGLSVKAAYKLIARAITALREHAGNRPVILFLAMFRRIIV